RPASLDCGVVGTNIKQRFDRPAATIDRPLLQRLADGVKEHDAHRFGQLPNENSAKGREGHQGVFVKELAPDEIAESLGDDAPSHQPVGGKKDRILADGKGGLPQRPAKSEAYHQQSSGGEDLGDLPPLVAFAGDIPGYRHPLYPLGAVRGGDPVPGSRRFHQPDGWIDTVVGRLHARNVLQRQVHGTGAEVDRRVLQSCLLLHCGFDLGRAVRAVKALENKLSRGGFHRVAPIFPQGNVLGPTGSARRCGRPPASSTPAFLPGGMSPGAWLSEASNDERQLEGSSPTRRRCRRRIAPETTTGRGFGYGSRQPTP